MFFPLQVDLALRASPARVASRQDQDGERTELAAAAAGRQGGSFEHTGSAQRPGPEQGRQKGGSAAGRGADTMGVMC